MNVLIDCVPILEGGGIQVAISLLGNLQRQSDIDWAAVIPTKLRAMLPPDLVADHRITFVPRTSQADRVWLTRHLMRIERSLGPDVVFTVFGAPFFRPLAPHLAGFALPNLIYARDPGMAQETLIDRFGNYLRCNLFRRADHLVVETEVARQRLARLLKIDDRSVSVIPNCQSQLLERLPSSPKPAGGPFKILIPSAFYPHKNLDIVPHVAMAMRRLAPQLDFEFQLTLPAHDPGWHRVRDDAERFGVGNNIVTLGLLKIGELAAAYRDASVVYLPSLREISTAVYPESFFFRRPLVTTDMDFAHELCGRAALFVVPRDAGNAARQLVGLATSPDRRDALVAAGEEQLALAYPTPARKFEMQLELLAKVASNPRRQTRTGRED